MPDDAEGIISADELNQLINLYVEFEGAFDPLAIPCKEAKQQFDSLVEHLFNTKVAPNYRSVTLPQFRACARRQCRSRAAKQSNPPYPCP